MADNPEKGLARFDPATSTPGELYIDARTGDTWKVVGWIVDPAAILENTRTRERHTEVIGCQNDKERWRPAASKSAPETKRGKQ